MPPPPIAYPIHDLPGCEGAAYQAVRGSDRPVCALTAALASYGRGGTMRGELTDKSPDEIEALFLQAFEEEQVPAERALLWAEAINGATLGRDLEEEKLLCEIQGVTFDEYQFKVVGDCTIAGHIDASSMGIGKTMGAAFKAVRIARRLNNFSRCWIIGTNTAHGAWTQVKANHAESWVDYLKRYFDEVQVISVDSAHKFVAASPVGGVVIFDEAHLMGMVSRRMKACHKIRQNFDGGVCLTGTLLHSGVENTLSIYDLAVPGMSLFSTKWKAGDHFKCLVQKELGSRKVTALAKPSAEKEKFKAWLARACVMLTVQEVEATTGKRLWPEQHLHEIRLGEPWPKLVDTIADIAMKIYDETGELPHMQKIAHILCREGIEAKVEHLLEEIADGTPLVAFAHYRESLDYFGSRLAEEGISYVRVDGDVVGAPRLDAQRRFQSGEVQVFLGQLHAAGISLDLFRASISVALDHSWSASDYAQALGRTARRGQVEETHHIDYVANRLQARVVSRLREAQDFNASCAEWIEGKRALRHAHEACGRVQPVDEQEPDDSSAGGGKEAAPVGKVLDVGEGDQQGVRQLPLPRDNESPSGELPPLHRPDARAMCAPQVRQTGVHKPEASVLGDAGAEQPGSGTEGAVEQNSPEPKAISPSGREDTEAVVKGPHAGEHRGEVRDVSAINTPHQVRSHLSPLSMGVTVKGLARQAIGLPFTPEIDS